MSTSRPAPTATTASTGTAPTPPGRTRLGVLELAVAMGLSGTIGVFVVESAASPLTVAFARCAVGAVALGLWCAARGYLTRPDVSRASLLFIVAGGLCLVTNWALLFASYEHTSIGVATVTYHVQPFLLVLFAPLVLGEALAIRQLAWVALGFAGLVLIAQPWTEPLTGSYGRGMLEAVSAAALYALATLLVKKVHGVRAHVIALVQLSIGAVILLPFARWVELTDVDAVPWLITLGIVHTAFMYVLVYDSYPRLKTATIAFLGFLYPVVAVVFDAVVYDHVLSLAQIGGSLLILLAGLGRAVAR
jgi:drug/metabolite transporter (DMT)-like permease